MHNLFRELQRQDTSRTLNNPAGFVLASLRDSPYGHGKEPVSAGSGKKKYVSPASTNVTLFIHRAVDLAGRSF